MKKKTGVYDTFNSAIFESVPTDALRILDFGCDTGNLGAALKNQDSRRYVAGVEISNEPASIAESRLDRLYRFNVEKDPLPEDEEPFDVIIFADVLEHLYDPQACLEKILPMLSEHGIVLCCIPNIQHHSIISGLLRGDFQYKDTGLLDRTHIRFFTLSGIQKMFLDAGYLPRNIGEVSLPNEALCDDLAPVMEKLGCGVLNRKNMNTFQYVFSAKKQPNEYPQEETGGMTFVTCVNNHEVYADNLGVSPDIGEESKHRLLYWEGAPSAAAVYNQAFDSANTEYICFVHQDVYLPKGWVARVQQQLLSIRPEHDNWVAGVFGIRLDNGRESGTLVDRSVFLDRPPYPSEVGSLDEVLLVMPAKSRLRFDSALGYHFFGTDICLQAGRAGGVAFTLDAPCIHNSQTVDDKYPNAFYQSGVALMKKWIEYPKLRTAVCRLTRLKDGRIEFH
ncbi:MAG: methyltransferase domain-containing protein [Pseudomonadales bacterium]